MTTSDMPIFKNALATCLGSSLSSRKDASLIPGIIISTRFAKRVDIIIPGINEASFLLDNDDPKQVAKAFLKMGISLVVIKLGAKGAYYATASEAEFVDRKSVG